MVRPSDRAGAFGSRRAVYCAACSRFIVMAAVPLAAESESGAEFAPRIGCVCGLPAESVRAILLAEAAENICVRRWMSGVRAALRSLWLSEKEVEAATAELFPLSPERRKQFQARLEEQAK